MSVISINCPNCSKSVNLDLDNIQGFCPNCGSKLMLDVSQLQAILLEKEKTKQTEIEEETKRTIILEQEKTKRDDNAYIIKIFIGLGIMFFVFIAFLIAICIIVNL